MLWVLSSGVSQAQTAETAQEPADTSGAAEPAEQPAEQPAQAAEQTASERAASEAQADAPAAGTSDEAVADIAVAESVTPETVVAADAVAADVVVPDLAEDSAPEEVAPEVERPLRADRQGAEYWVGGQFHAFYLTAMFDREPIQLSMGLGANFGIRGPRAGLMVTLENTWFAVPEADDDPNEAFRGVAQGVVALLVGFEVLYAQDRLRFHMAAGPSVLLRNGAVDEAGTVGIAIDMRPVGIRVPIGGNRTVSIDPLGFTVLLADPSGIPNVRFQFRTTVSLEFDLSNRSAS